jgi:hypothetical protein
MNPVHLPKYVSGKMNRTPVPIVVDVCAKRLHVICNECGLRRLVKTSMNLHRRIPKCAGQSVQPVKGGLMQLQNRTGAQFKGPLRILHVRADDL